MMYERRTMVVSSGNYQTREDDGELYIEGYFAVFNSPYVIMDGVTEIVAPGAFSDTLGEDIRALTNHDTTLVLGRNKAGTLTLREDSHGLWGSIRINQADADAMNLYNRVKRGDVISAVSALSSWPRNAGSWKTATCSTSSSKCACSRCPWSHSQLTRIPLSPPEPGRRKISANGSLLREKKN